MLLSPLPASLTIYHVKKNVVMIGFWTNNTNIGSSDSFDASAILQFASRYGYMIDNIVLLITGTLHQRPISELVRQS